MLPPTMAPAPPSAGFVRMMLFPPRLKLPAVGLKAILLKSVPAAKSLFGVNCVVPSKKSKSPATGAVPPQLLGSLQLLVPPPPVQVSLPAKADCAQTRRRDEK